MNSGAYDRDELFDRLLAGAPPDFAERFADNMNALLLAETQDVSALLDWVGVAAMKPLRERVLVMCAEYLSRTGQASVDEALALGRAALAAAWAASGRTDDLADTAASEPGGFADFGERAGLHGFADRRDPR